MDPSAFSEYIDRKIADALPLMIGKVSALGDDGLTVNLAFGTGLIEDVPCSSGYPIRAVGDDVLVIRTAAGNWSVMCKLSEAVVDYVTKDELGTSTDQLTADLTGKINDLAGDVAEVSFGSGAPGVGWTLATETHFRDLGGGKKAIYLRNVTPPAATTKPPPAPTQTVPKSVFINPTARGSWRSSGQTDDDVWQGSWTSLGNWVGAWFYGTSIADACVGKSVRSIELRLARTKSGGWSRGVQSRIGLHDRTTKGNPPQIVNSQYAVKLEPGEVQWWTVPEAFENSLQDGTTKGFFAEGAGDDQYIHYSAGAGQVKINFNAS